MLRYVHFLSVLCVKKKTFLSIQGKEIRLEFQNKTLGVFFGNVLVCNILQRNSDIKNTFQYLE